MVLMLKIGHRNFGFVLGLLWLVSLSPAWAQDYKLIAECAPIEDEAARNLCFAQINSGQKPPVLPGCRKPVLLGDELLCMDEPFTVGDGQLPATPPPAAEPVPAGSTKAKIKAARATREDVLAAIAGLSAGSIWTVKNRQSAITDTEDVTLTLPSTNDVDDDRGGMATAYLHIRCKDDTTDVILGMGNHWFHSEHWVTTRLDKTKARTQKWGGSTNNTVVFHPSPISFAKQLIGAKALVVQVAPINSGIQQAIFDLEDISDVIKPLRLACGW